MNENILPTVEVGPTGPCSAVVIWLHGLGASGHDFEPIVPLLNLPDVRFVFPHARARPVTINMGHVMPAWYDILSMEPSASRESAEDILESAQEVSALIERENARGVATDRIVLAGFSQGGAMALHVGHRYPEQLAGIMILSAYLVLEDTIEKEASVANAQTPSLFCHGTEDAMVPFKGGQHAFEHTALTNKHVIWQEYPMGHEVCIEEIEDIRDWLHELLSVA
jgi:phospholipase/carboxylesterase